MIRVKPCDYTWKGKMYSNFVEVGPCDLIMVSFRVPSILCLRWFSEGDSRASGTVSNGSGSNKARKNEKVVVGLSSWNSIVGDNFT